MFTRQKTTEDRKRAVNFKRKILLVSLLFFISITGLQCGRITQHRIDRLLHKGEISAIVEMGNSTIPFLTKALNHKSWVIRMRAAIAIGRIGDKSATPVLITALKDENWRVRVCAVKALEEIRDASALPYIEKALEDEDENVRRCAARAIENIKPK